MPKVTYKCVDCGKERTAYLSKFEGVSIEEYRCRKCFCKSRNSKIIYKCADCGKERIDFPSYSKRLRGEIYRCKKCAVKKSNSEVEHLHLKELTYVCIDCGKERAGYLSDFNKPREEYRCILCASKLRSKNPIWIENNKIIGKNNINNPLWKENQRKAIDKRVNDTEWQKMMAERNKRISKDPKRIENYKKSMQKHYVGWSEKQKEMFQDPIIKERLLISTTGEGFWYGNKTLKKWNNGGYRKYYCELWNKDLWDRIDAAYDYRSILSGRTRFENYKQEHLSRHHLYWQEKACCEWDEDTNGYYAWINNGSKRNPEWIKYYIKGDPNKFVLLTRDEHGKVRGSKKSGKDKIWWIMHMEDLVEQRAKEGKKCYLSHEEYEVYKIEHADIIAKYKNK